MSFCLVSFKAAAQTVSINPVDPGPYGQGSTIGVPFQLNTTATCASSTNVFNLYLSDASGNFASKTLIGNYKGFYGTFVNGVIPAGTPAGTNYRVRIEATDPAIAPSAAVPITITAATGVTAAASSTAIDPNFPEVFGTCIGTDNTSYPFVDGSTPGTTVTASFHNELTNTNEGTITVSGSFVAKAANYTVLVKAIGVGVIGTKAYSLVNNVVNNGFSTSGSTSVCLSGQNKLVYTVDITSAQGIERNYPGNIYTVTWGDGLSSNYTLCEIIQAGGKIDHTYLKASCGNVANGQANVFQVDFQPVSPYCGRPVTPFTGYARVVAPPINRFLRPDNACTNEPVKFNNTSIPGQDPNSTSFDCSNINALYSWVVDGQVVAVNYKLDQVFEYTFKTHGQHFVGLHLQNGNLLCEVEDKVLDICVQDAPKPSFTLPGSTICTSGAITPVNTSVVDEVCNNGTTYRWKVTGPAPIGYLGGTSASSKNPRFDIKSSGLYTVQLDITTLSCGTVSSKTDEIVVNLNPTASLSPDAMLCGNNQTLAFSPTATNTRTTLTGTSKALPTTYTWTVTGGTYSFVNGTTANSRYPEILFNDYATYTISVLHVNNCNSATDTQQLTFQPAPLVAAGGDVTICEGAQASLAGSITGSATGFSWKGGTGTFTAGRSSLTGNYIPSAAEIAAGSVTLNLEATTNLAAPCNIIQDPIVITITRKDNITSANATDACSGSNFTYAITSANPVSVHRWTATLTSGSASGFGASGQGNTINDVITNTGSVDAVVTYRIIPTTDGCDGIPFDLQVNVRRIPVVTAAAASPSICSLQAAGINLSSNISGTTYTWTSTSPAGASGNTQQTTPVSTLSIADILSNGSNAVATVVYTITPYNNGCAGTPVTAQVNVIPLPVLSQPGTDAEICNTPTYQLNGNDPSPGTGRWTLTSGQAGVTFSDPTNPKAIASGLQPGNVYQFTWTISSAPTCPPTSNFVTITVDGETVGGTVAGATNVCAGSNTGFLNLNGNVGNILRWEFSVDNGATWTSLANVTTQLEYLNLTQTTEYRAIVQNGLCNIQPSATAIITVNQPAVIANAGPDDRFCNALQVQLQGNSPLPNTGVWSQVAGPPVVFVDPADPQTRVTGLLGGNIYRFVWTIKGVPPCDDNSDEVEITNTADAIPTFTADRVDGCGPVPVEFTNTSNFINGTSFYWDFGDGTTSTLASPQHTFAPTTDGKDITYRVSLVVLNNCVPHAPFTMDITVRPTVPVAAILPDQLNGCGAFTINARNVSPGNNTQYDFYLYDGSRLVEHIIKLDKSDATFQAVSTTKATTFTLSMVATGFCQNTGSIDNPIPIVISPATHIAQTFVKAGLPSKGCVPFSTVFVNNSSGGNTFEYLIRNGADNTVTRIQGSPDEQPYTFTQPGTYFVSIVATNECASVTSTTEVRIDVSPIPVPAFDADVKSGCKAEAVTFENLTADNGSTPAASLGYDWDFGDGTNHFTGFKPPAHVYAARSTPYTVTLTVTNLATGCANSVTRTNFITVNNPPLVNFTVKPDTITEIPNYHFAFEDHTTNNPVRWEWDFGDGSSSNEQNPSHTYADTGRYTVALRVLNREGCDSTLIRHVQITGTPGQLYLPNAFMPASGTSELKVFAAKGSGIENWRLQIFNNWGQLVWETTKLSSKGEPLEGWDGTFKGSPAPQGVYVWQASAHFINGTDWKGMSYKNSLPKRTGVIHLIR